MKSWKALNSISFLMVSFSVLFAWNSGSLFPAVPLGFLIIGLVGITLSYRDLSNKQALVTVFSIITTTVLLRWYIYEFPIGFIGFDPDKYAIWSNIILNTGSFSEIPNSFYKSAPNGFLFPSIVSLVSGVSIRHGLGTYALILGILIPILSLTLISRVKQKNPQLMVGVTVFASTFAMLIKIGYWPIAQNMATILFQLFLFLLVIYHQTLSRKILILVFLVLVSISYSHKLQLVLVLGVLLVYLLYKYIGSISQNSGSRAYLQNRTILIILSGITLIGWFITAYFFASKIISLVGFTAGILIIYILGRGLTTNSWISDSKTINKDFSLLIAFTGILLALQWIYQTGFIKTLFYFYLIPSNIGSSVDSQKFTHAVQTQPGMLDLFFHLSHILILILLATLIAIWLISSDTVRRDILISSTGLLLLLTPSSITVQTSTGLGATRLVPNFSITLAVLLGIGLVGVPSKPDTKAIAKVVFLIMIIFQAGSVAIVPDYPHTYRAYLTNEEIQAKEFANKYTDDRIITDYWYAEEDLSPLEGKYADQNTVFRGVTSGYVNSTLFDKEYKYILFRTDVVVYRFAAAGHWILSWNPEYEIKQDYCVTYDNGGARLYYSCITSPREEV